MLVLIALSLLLASRVHSRLCYTCSHLKLNQSCPRDATPKNISDAFSCVLWRHRGEKGEVSKVIRQTYLFHAECARTQQWKDFISRRYGVEGEMDCCTTDLCNTAKVLSVAPSFNTSHTQKNYTTVCAKTTFLNISKPLEAMHLIAMVEEHEEIIFSRHRRGGAQTKNNRSRRSIPGERTNHTFSHGKEIHGEDNGVCKGNERMESSHALKVANITNKTVFKVDSKVAAPSDRLSSVQLVIGDREKIFQFVTATPIKHKNVLGSSIFNHTTSGNPSLQTDPSRPTNSSQPINKINQTPLRSPIYLAPSISMKDANNKSTPGTPTRKILDSKILNITSSLDKINPTLLFTKINPIPSPKEIDPIPPKMNSIPLKINPIPPAVMINPILSPIMINPIPPQTKINPIPPPTKITPIPPPTKKNLIPPPIKINPIQPPIKINPIPPLSTKKDPNPPATSIGSTPNTITNLWMVNSSSLGHHAGQTSNSNLKLEPNQIHTAETKNHTTETQNQTAEFKNGKDETKNHSTETIAVTENPKIVVFFIKFTNISASNNITIRLLDSRLNVSRMYSVEISQTGSRGNFTIVVSSLQEHGVGNTTSTLGVGNTTSTLGVGNTTSTLLLRNVMNPMKLDEYTGFWIRKKNSMLEFGSLDPKQNNAMKTPLVSWVDPKGVVEVEYVGFTGGGAGTYIQYSCSISRITGSGKSNQNKTLK